jgi:hypothetical protein
MCGYGNPIHLNDNRLALQDGSEDNPIGIPSSPPGSESTDASSSSQVTTLPGEQRAHRRAPVGVMGRSLAQQARNQAIAQGQAVNSINHPHSGGAPYQGVRLASNGNARFVQQQQSGRPHNPSSALELASLYLLLFLETATVYEDDSSEGHSEREYKQLGK